MTDTKHTDSVEARFNAKFNTHPYDKAQHIEYKAKEIIRFIKSEIKKSNSQQVEEAVRKERERIISLAGGEPYIYVPNITEANSDTK